MNFSTNSVKIRAKPKYQSFHYEMTSSFDGVEDKALIVDVKDKIALPPSLRVKSPVVPATLIEEKKVLVVEVEKWETLAIRIPDIPFRK